MKNGVIGTWFVVDANEVDYEGDLEVFRSGMVADFGAFIEFKADGQGSVFDIKTGHDLFTYVSSEGNLTLEYLDEENSTSYYRIRELTNSSLSIYEEYVEEYEGAVHKEVIEINLRKYLPGNN